MKVKVFFAVGCDDGKIGKAGWGWPLQRTGPGKDVPMKVKVFLPSLVMTAR